MGCPIQTLNAIIKEQAARREKRQNVRKESICGAV